MDETPGTLAGAETVLAEAGATRHHRTAADVLRFVVVAFYLLLVLILLLVTRKVRFNVSPLRALRRWLSRLRVRLPGRYPCKET